MRRQAGLHLAVLVLPLLLFAVAGPIAINRGFIIGGGNPIAGVLLVFCYLIVPSVAAMLYSDHIGKRLAIGWSMGTIVSALGAPEPGLPLAVRASARMSEERG